MTAWRAPALLRAALALALVSCAAVPALPIQIMITTGAGGWVVNVPIADLPVVPGADMSVSTYTSPNPQTIINVRKNPGGWMAGATGWILTVRKVDAAWDSRLHLWIQRTSANAGLSGNVNVYQEITGIDAEICRSTTQSNANNITWQLQLRGVSVAVGTANTTTVYYTVTEY